jgi:hypothetical protein
MRPSDSPFAPWQKKNYKRGRFCRPISPAPVKEQDAQMKTTTRSIIYLLMTAMILTAALAVPAAAQQQVPFKGTMQGNDTDSPGPSSTTVVVTTTGTGIGTLLGQFSFKQETTVDFTTSTDAGHAVWTAANGDSISTAVAGSGGPTGTTNVIKITEVNTITGGTGRFAGAQGTFIVERLANVATFLTSGSFAGTITPPGAAH